MKPIALALIATTLGGASALAQPEYDVLIRGGTVYDGSGAPGFVGDVALRADRIAYVGPHAPGAAARTIDAKGEAVAPGFINMLAHPEESLLIDGRALSDLAQGVTLEVIGEDSMAPLNDRMRAEMIAAQSDVKYPVTWTTLGQYMTGLERRGISLNVASYVGAGTVRNFVLGEADVKPTPAQLDAMRQEVHKAMEDGAVGVTTALIYAPNTYASTDELKVLATEAGKCGGLYSAHIRNEGDHVQDAVSETIAIAKASGAPAEIYHLKLAGRQNWDKYPALVEQVETARAAGTRITADMYVYTAGATGLDAAMPRWVQSGGLDQWIANLKDPAKRARVTADVQNPHPDWDNLYLDAGGGKNMLFLQFKNPALKKYTGRTLADVARERGKSEIDTMMDLVVEDGSRVGVAYFVISEDNIAKQVAMPWVSFDSDEEGAAPEGVFLLHKNHPRAYGNFARVLAKYVRDEHALTLPQAVRKLSAMPAEVLSLDHRGHLVAGDYADVVVFDPATIQDHATYDNPAQLATGVEQVFVNGVAAISDGKPTGAPSGRWVKGRGALGQPGGGCRASAADWQWAKD